MKKMINGIMYDTDTARLIGEWHNGEDHLNSVTEKLYNKRTGEFFLYGSGGSESKYAKIVNGKWCGGEEIIVLKYKEAKEWAKEHLETIISTDEKGARSFFIKNSNADKLKMLANKHSMSMSKMLDIIIEEFTDE